MTATKELLIEEPSGMCSILEIPADRHVALLHAAAGLVAAAPNTDGRARSLELLAEGGAPALLLAVRIVGEALSG